MKASELIARLTELMSEHGDRDVTGTWYHTEACNPVDDVVVERDGTFYMYPE